MEAAEQEKKTSTTTRPDGAKLSFQVKSRSLVFSKTIYHEVILKIFSPFAGKNETVQSWSWREHSQQYRQENLQSSKGPRITLSRIVPIKKSHRYNFPENSREVKKSGTKLQNETFFTLLSSRSYIVKQSEPFWVVKSYTADFLSTSFINNWWHSQKERPIVKSILFSSNYCNIM